MDLTRGALTGLRVLDITQVMAGPFCGMVLADLGADVIKIEPPSGDSTRQMPGRVGTESPSFNAVNRGKRSVIVNLKTRAGQDAVTRMAAVSDILIENYRPGVLDGLGLGYAAVSAINPRLIYASISGYGQTGPDRDKGGFDLVAQGVSGIMSITGERGGPPMKAGVPLTDLGAGLFALVGILAAVEYRHHTDRGQHVDTSLVEAGVALSVWEATEYFHTGVSPQPMASAHRMFAPYQAIRCADGFMTLGTANDRLFTRFCELLDHAEWATDPRFADNPTRVANQAALAAEIESVTATRPAREWIALFDANDIPCGPINDYAQVFSDPHLAAREMSVDIDHPVLGPMQALGSALKMSATPTNPRRRAPLLGEHTNTVLAELGFSEDEIDKLRSAGAIT
ncbi:MAG TPA: CoA transferase [Vicinamibacterales bacterium]|nr:CoA transferase [Vicinamibacterales bacterium]